MLVRVGSCTITPNQSYRSNGNGNLLDEFLIGRETRTNQHSCDDVNGDCVILLQYTCSDTLRDGQTTKYQIGSQSKLFLSIFY